MFQIGLRGTGYTAEDFDWASERGFQIVQAEQLWHQSAAPLMDHIRQQIGTRPVHRPGTDLLTNVVHERRCGLMPELFSLHDLKTTLTSPIKIFSCIPSATQANLKHMISVKQLFFECPAKRRAVSPGIRRRVA